MKSTFFFFLIFFSLNAVGQRLYFFDRETPNKTEKIYTIKNQGFVRNTIDNSGNKTVFRSEFFNLKAEKTAEHSTSFTKSEYLGHAFNGKFHIFLFLDNYHRFVYIPKYSKDGNFITIHAGKASSNIKNAALVYYDSSAFYTVRRKGARFTFSKISYQNDTIWERDVFDNGKPIAFNKAEKIDNLLYMVFNSPETSTRIISANDVTGDLIFDKEIGEQDVHRFASKLIIDKASKEIIMAGRETRGRKKGSRVFGSFITSFDLEGNIVKANFYPEKNIKLETSDFLDEESKKRIKEVDFREIIKFKNEYVLIGENRYRTDFAGEGMIVSLIAVGLTGIPVVSSGIDIVYTSFDLVLIRPSDDSLIYAPIEKKPIARFFPTIESSLDREPYEFFDYQFSKDIPGGKEIFFFQNLTKDQFTIATIKITPDGPPIMKKITLNEKNERGKNYNIFLLSDDSLLLHNKTNSSSGFGVISLSRFK